MIRASHLRKSHWWSAPSVRHCHLTLWRSTGKHYRYWGYQEKADSPLSQNGEKILKGRHKKDE